MADLFRDGAAAEHAAVEARNVAPKPLDQLADCDERGGEVEGAWTIGRPGPLWAMPPGLVGVQPGSVLVHRKVYVA